jgi:hypothetical protein
MAITCRIDLDPGRLRDEIRAIYARVATDPSTGFHFRRGSAYAAERLGYDSTALAALPSDTTLPSRASQIQLRMARACHPHYADSESVVRLY